MADNKLIVLGVTGSIAAHKAVDLCSLLAKAGADVHVVMTKDALEFVTPLPFKTLSRNRPHRRARRRQHREGRDARQRRRWGMRR